MKRFIALLACVAAAALLAVLVLKFLSPDGPRVRARTSDGNGIIIEELSYYKGDEKEFGKLFRPEDGTGLPGAVFFHEPLKTKASESILRQLAGEGVLGYQSALHGGARDVEFIVKRFSGEKAVAPGMVFVISDSYCSDAVVNAVLKLGHRIQGLVLIDPQLGDKASGVVDRYGDEFLVIDTARDGDIMGMIEDYLESKGALK